MWKQKQTNEKPSIIVEDNNSIMKLFTGCKWTCADVPYLYHTAEITHKKRYISEALWWLTKEEEASHLPEPEWLLPGTAPAQELYMASTYCVLCHQVPTDISFGDPGHVECPLPPRYLKKKMYTEARAHVMGIHTNWWCCSMGSGWVYTALGTMKSQQEKCCWFWEFKL